jgi:hypothetical protein
MAKSCSLGSGQTSDKNNLSDGVTWTVSVERPAALLILSENEKYCDEQLHDLNLTLKVNVQKGEILLGCKRRIMWAAGVKDERQVPSSY